MDKNRIRAISGWEIRRFDAPVGKGFFGQIVLNTFLTPTAHLLISRFSRVASWCGHERAQPGIKPVTDFIYIAVITLFFVASGLYARWCEKL
jgi:hypothetical protein